MSSAERTNDSATMSTPLRRAQRRSSVSFSLIAGTLTRDAWKVDPFVVADRPADDHFGDHVGVGDLACPQGYPAIVDQDQVAGPDIARQALVRRGATFDRALDVLDGDRERVADVQFFLAVGEPAEPDLRALKVCQHTDRATGAFCRIPDAAQVSLRWSA